MTTTLNLPCIWAMVSYLSNRSFYAVSSTFGTWMLRKMWERPLNHPDLKVMYRTSISASLLI
jgi:hypothetical protein